MDVLDLLDEAERDRCKECQNSGVNLDPENPLSSALIPCRNPRCYFRLRDANIRALIDVAKAAREMKHVYDKLKELNNRRDLSPRAIFSQLQAEYDAHGAMFEALTKLGDGDG